MGAAFACDGFVDFYVRDGGDIELTGKYKEIVPYIKELAIIDIRNESKKDLNLKKDFMFVSCSENYDAFKIECSGKETITIRRGENMDVEL